MDPWKSRRPTCPPPSSLAPKPPSPSRSRSPTPPRCSTSRRPSSSGSTRPASSPPPRPSGGSTPTARPIQVGDTKLTSKGKLKKEYQTPYGVAAVERHVYQSSRGGKTYCPLDRDARIVVSSTPKFAKMVSHKYAEFGSARVIKDLAENHGRSVARCFVQDVADAVATVALAKQEDWEYALPELEETPPTITIGMDGTCLLMCEGGWRETMVGTIGFYDAEGDRQHTIYLAATPEYGKATFLERMEREIDRVKAAYPRARYVGLADGAKGNWEFLGRQPRTR